MQISRTNHSSLMYKCKLTIDRNNEISCSVTLSGFNPEHFRTLGGRYRPLACYGEVKLAMCITQSLPYLETYRVGSWIETHNARDNCGATAPTDGDTVPVTFNEGIELPLPYSSLYDYSGVCFILCSTLSDTSGLHNQYLAGCHLSLFNSKKYVLLNFECLVICG